jgi:hypothetical protein
LGEQDIVNGDVRPEIVAIAAGLNSDATETCEVSVTSGRCLHGVSLCTHTYLNVNWAVIGFAAVAAEGKKLDSLILACFHSVPVDSPVCTARPRTYNAKLSDRDARLAGTIGERRVKMGGEES